MLETSQIDTMKKWVMRVRHYHLSRSGGHSGARKDMVFCSLAKKAKCHSGVYLFFMFETGDITTHRLALKVDSCIVVLSFVTLLLRKRKINL